MKERTYEMSCDAEGCDVKQVGVTEDELGSGYWHVVEYDGVMLRYLCDGCFDRSLAFFKCPPAPNDAEHGPDPITVYREVEHATGEVSVQLESDVGNLDNAYDERYVLLSDHEKKLEQLSGDII